MHDHTISASKQGHPTQVTHTLPQLACTLLVRSESDSPGGFGTVRSRPHTSQTPVANPVNLHARVLRAFGTAAGEDGQGVPGHAWNRDCKKHCSELQVWKLRSVCCIFYLESLEALKK